MWTCGYNGSFWKAKSEKHELVLCAARCSMYKGDGCAGAAPATTAGSALHRQMLSGSVVVEHAKTSHSADAGAYDCSISRERWGSHQHVFGLERRGRSTEEKKYEEQNPKFRVTGDAAATRYRSLKRKWRQIAIGSMNFTSTQTPRKISHVLHTV